MKTLSIADLLDIQAKDNEIKCLRTALERYADPRVYERKKEEWSDSAGIFVSMNMPPWIEFDKGRLARETLESKS